MVFRVLPNGSKFYLPDEDTGFHADRIDRFIDGIYSVDSKHFYEKYYSLRAGMTVVDAGACRGLFTLKASKTVGSEGRVISLEPFRPSYNVLSYNVYLNDCANVVLLREGLWSKTGEKSLRIAASYSGNYISERSLASLLPHLWHPIRLYWFLKRKTQWVNIRVTSLDDLMDRFNLKEINFLKMDIEGSEIEALKGYSKVRKGNILVLESHGNLDDLTPILREKGFFFDVVSINERKSIIHAKFGG